VRIQLFRKEKSEREIRESKEMNGSSDIHSRCLLDSSVYSQEN